MNVSGNLRYLYTILQDFRSEFILNRRRFTSLNTSVCTLCGMYLLWNFNLEFYARRIKKHPDINWRYSVDEILFAKIYSCKSFWVGLSTDLNSWQSNVQHILLIYAQIPFCPIVTKMDLVSINCVPQSERLGSGENHNIINSKIWKIYAVESRKNNNRDK